MRVRSFSASTVTGLLRAIVLLALGLVVPVLAALLPALSALLGSPWTVGNPWTWVGYACLFAPIALVLAMPIAAATVRLVNAWTDRPIERRAAVADEPQPVVQLATGFWWNGHSYERTRRDALADQRWRRLVGYPGYWHDVGWVVIAAVVVAPLCALPIVALAFAVALGVHGTLPAWLAAVALVVVFAAAARHVWRPAVAMAVRCLDDERAAESGDRVRQLESQRADLTIAQAAELRRIERNLHDGAQARLVGVGLSLATAEALLETDPEQVRALLREARAGTSQSLAELRSLVRGIDPPVLVERGLVEALRALALDSPVRTAVDADSTIRLEAPIEAALYFGVAELLANAGKYAPDAHALITVTHEDGAVVCLVTNDGPGGAAEKPGGGLEGIRRRIAVFDGTMTIDSPPAGPTTVQLWVPCASS